MALAQVYQFPQEETTPRVAMTRRPSFQFYPADWRKDPALAACSLAARGLWMEMLCIAHESERYGFLCINGKPMALAQIARIVGEAQQLVGKLIGELEDSGVLSRTDDGTIYSRRMIRDEQVRNTRAANGIKGAQHGSKGGSHGAKGGRPRKEDNPPQPLQETPQEPPQETPQETPQDSFKEPPPSSSSSSSINSVPIGTAATPQAPGVTAKSPDELAKQELWRSAVSLLKSQGIDEQQARSLMGKLVKDHGNDKVLDAVRNAVATQPADARAWLVQACKDAGSKRAPKAENFDAKNYGEGVGVL